MLLYLVMVGAVLIRTTTENIAFFQYIFMFPESKPLVGFLRKSKQSASITFVSVTNCVFSIQNPIELNENLNLFVYLG